MHLLVLDTIHGGKSLAHALAGLGHAVDMVDVYRGMDGISASVALSRVYDMVIAPIHLDPGHTLLRETKAPSITHHQAVRWIIGKNTPARFVEVTGARGKTTTASALAHLMQGQGILHTSCGTFRLPERTVIGREGITPASLIGVTGSVQSTDRWLIAEVSLGFTGGSELGILTSLETYPFAAGKRDALTEKLRSGACLPRIITPPGSDRSGNRLPADAVATADEDVCRYAWGEISGSYHNPLLGQEAYRDPLLIATAAACILGIDPSPLSGFEPLEGRKTVFFAGKSLIVDDSNSGTCGRTARDAIALARRLAGENAPLTLVIGKEKGAICEGFPVNEIASVIGEESPDRVILVGDYDPATLYPDGGDGYCISRAGTLDEGKSLAMQSPEGSMIILAVKTWR